MERYISRWASAWETPFHCIACPSAVNPDVMMYNFVGIWRLAPKEEFLRRWKPEADRPTN